MEFPFSAVLNNARTNSRMKFSLLILCYLIVYAVFCQNDAQQYNKPAKNLGDLLTLKKIITINLPSISEGNSLKIKVKNGFLYLLNDDFITNEGLILIRENIETNIRDTNFINTELFMSNINDFDVNGDNLFILSNNQIITSNLVTKATRNDLISFHANLTYHHFFNINPETFIFYEWKIGQRNIEQKNIYKYDMPRKKWELIDSN